MATDQHKLEKHLRWNNDDLSAWAVYADWLQEQEDDRGMHIARYLRLQTAIGVEARKLRAERLLLQLHRQPVWTNPLHNQAVGFHGFVETAILFWEREQTRQKLHMFLSTPNAALLTRLQLRTHLDDSSDAHIHILESVDLQQIQELELLNLILKPEGAETLTKMHLPDLKVLKLTGTFLGDRGIRTITEAPWFGQLTAARLEGNGLSFVAWKELRELLKVRGIENLNKVPR